MYLNMKRNICYLLTIHTVALIVFTLFRLVLFFNTNYTFPEEIQHDYLLQAEAFVRGVWFDNVIACYISILPLVMLWIVSLCRYQSKWIYSFCQGWFITLYTVAFIICASNIPYFDYFFKIINSSIYNWFEYAGTTAGMIFGETSYYFPIALGIATIGIWAWFVTKVTKRFLNKIRKEGERKAPFQLPQFIGTFFIGVALIGLCCLGIRGRLGYNHIRTSQSYYCQDPFLNQLGVNPVFNLLYSTTEDMRKEKRQLTLMDNNEAIAKAQSFLNRKGIEGISPLARKIDADTSRQTHPNILLIFMESMSSKLMAAFGNPQGLTPYLDSLYNHSLVFDNIWSAGIHTNQGMYSTLYSFPTIMKRNAMKGSVIPVYSGFPTVLKDNGYRNLFFMTHESQYDNMNAFYRTNGFDEIYAEENYPKEKIANHWGVPDDFLYEYALPILTDRAATGQPFFGVLLSISNHPPYVIPPYFQPRNSNIENQIVEYADWSIRKLMTEAKKQPWFENTLFVFIGDHGKLVGSPENEMPESYNHVPFMIYGKGIIPDTNHSLGTQIDVAPTLLGMLGIGYTQIGLGVDLLREQRPCTFYTADNLIAARDSSRLYIHQPETGQEFRYTFGEGKLNTASEDEEFQNLKEYVFTMLQATEELVKQGKTVDKLNDQK